MREFVSGLPSYRFIYSDTPLIDHLVMREFVSGPDRLATASYTREFVTESPVLGKVPVKSPLTILQHITKHCATLQHYIA